LPSFLQSLHVIIRRYIKIATIACSTSITSILEKFNVDKQKENPKLIAGMKILRSIAGCPHFSIRRNEYIREN
jgi:hypothetical protein